MNPREEVLARIRAAVQDGPVQDGAVRNGPVRNGPVQDGAVRNGPVRNGPVRNGPVPPAGGQAGTGPGSAAQPSPEPAPGYRERGDLDGARLIDLLAERLADYRAAVRRAPAAGLAEAVATALTERAARRVVVPPGLDLPALPDGVEAVTDDGLTAGELDAFDGVITGAAVAIAETGTIVLDGSPDQGRRAITLVPDYHLCLVHAAQVVELVPEAIARLAPRAGQPLTWISGPSATSDIELNRVEGVHGPRTLEVILVGPA